MARIRINMRLVSREVLRTYHASLCPELRYISQEAVRSKWKFILENTENKVKELFRSIKRPVIARKLGESSKIDA